MTTLAWGAKVNAGFRSRVLALAARLECDPSDLMAVMYFESRLDPAAVNAQSGASGLIQAISSTAQRLGVTLAEIRAMPAEEQLERVVTPYFLPFAGRLRTLEDTYMAVLWPAAVGKPYDFVLFAKGSTAYAQNQALDVNGDGTITKLEASAFVVRAKNEGMKAANAAVVREARDEGALPSPARPPAGGPSNQPEDNDMGIALPLLAQLIPQVLALFSGRAQATIAEKTGADPKVAADFMQAMIAQVGHAVGVPVVDDTTATQAVATLTALPADGRGEKAAALERQALATLDAIMKAGDKMAEWDAAKWAAELKGKDSAADRTIKERAAGLWDMTKTLVINQEGQVWYLMTILLSLTAYALYKDKWETALSILAGLTTIGGWIMKRASQPTDYRFDGTKEGSEQSKAITKALENQGAQR